MKFLPYLLKHLRRNWVRTASTVMAMAVCIFLFCTPPDHPRRRHLGLEERQRLPPRHAARGEPGLPPASHLQGADQGRPRGEERRRSRTGSSASWAGGSPTSATSSRTSRWTPRSTSRCTPSTSSLPKRRRPSCEDRRGCIVGPDTAKKFGWKVGDTFLLESFIPPYRVGRPFDFVIRGHLQGRRRQVPGHGRPPHVLQLEVPLRVHPAACADRHLRRGDRRPRAGGRHQQGHRRAVREQRRPDQDRDRGRLPRGLRLHGREPGPAPERHRPGRHLHHPAGDRQHHEHGGARAAHRDRGAQDPGLRQRPGDGPDPGRSRCCSAILGGVVGSEPLPCS